jgi:hypothetical protein
MSDKSVRFSVQPTMLVVVADYLGETDNLSGVSPHQIADSQFATLSVGNLAPYELLAPRADMPSRSLP